MVPVLVLSLALSGGPVNAGQALSHKLPAPLVPVTVQVDFGPAGKSPIVKNISVPKGASPKQALKRVSAVEEGKTCCHPGEVKGIDGVPVDPLQNRWWTLKINGTRKGASPQRSRLKAGDVVEWIYIQENQ